MVLWGSSVPLLAPLPLHGDAGGVGGSLPIQPHGGITLTCRDFISSIKMK
jgi:hypothetical protein